MQFTKIPAHQLFNKSAVTWQEFDCRKGQARASAGYLASLAHKHYSISSAVWKSHCEGAYAFMAAVSVLEIAEADLDQREDKYKTVGPRSIPTVRPAMNTAPKQAHDFETKDVKVVEIKKATKVSVARDPKEVVWDAVKSGNFELAKYVVATT